MPSSLTAPVGLLLSSIGFSAADAADGGLNLLGIAALITSISGLIGTVGALWIAARKKETDPNAARLADALDRLADREEDQS